MSEILQNSKSDGVVRVETLLESPWAIWKEADAYQALLRQQLLEFLEKALEIRFRRSNYKAELQKKRSRKGAAAKRAVVASKRQATRLKESLINLDLEQLWTNIELKVSGGIGELQERLEKILSQDLTNIFKQGSANDLGAFMQQGEILQGLNRYGNDDEDSDSSSDDVPPKYNSDPDSDPDLGAEENHLDQDSESSDVENVENDSVEPKNENASSKLDDEFFKMDEMEEFADKEFESDDINYFDSLGEESDDSVAPDQMKYDDFFKEPKKSQRKTPSRNAKVGFDTNEDVETLDKEEAELERLLQQVQDEIDTDEEDDEDDDDDDENEDDYDGGGDDNDDDGVEIEKEKLGDLAYLNDAFAADATEENDEKDDPIAAIERELAADKHWSLMGEATASRRPRNSLLDVDLELPQLAQAIQQGKDESLLVVEGTAGEDGAAIGDADATQDDPRLEFEEIIKQRIKAQVFDNVERKMALEDQLEAIERLKKSRANVEEIDFIKSSLGLGDLYAQRYMDHFMATDKLDAHKKKLTESFAALMCKLDALSNYNMVPKMASKAQQAAAIPMLTVETPVNIVTTKRQAVESPQDVKVSRAAKKRKFTNKIKALLKSGKLDKVQVDKIRASIKKKNQKRIADAKMAKTSGNARQKDTRRLNIGQLLQDISNK